MITLVDLIFNGKFGTFDFDLIKKLLPFAKEKNFFFPEDILIESIEQVIFVFKSNDYVDFVLSAKHVEILNKIIPNVFINIGRDNENIEILFFLDIKDLDTNFENGLKDLNKWAESLKKQYKLERFICRMDGEKDGDNYYFEDNWR